MPLLDCPDLIVLALDFDGVLHPALPYFDEQGSNPHFQDLPALEAALEPFPQVGLLISSSWRRRRSRQDLLKAFSPALRQRVLDVTPELPNTHAAGVRQREVETWMADFAPHARWVALDDVAECYLPGACVVVTGDGFGPREAALLTQALTDPVAFARAHPVVHDPRAMIVR